MKLYTKTSLIITLSGLFLVPFQAQSQHKSIQLDSVTHAITISHDFFDREIVQIMERLAKETEEINLVTCYQAIIQQHNDIDVQQAIKAFMTITNYLEMQSKAPRPDGQFDDGIVGPLLECDVFRVLAHLQELEDAIITCCAQLQIDFNGVFTELIAIRSSFTTCCAQTELDLAGTFTTLSEIFNTLTSCCVNSIASATTLEATVINDFNGTFSMIADIQNSLTTCCTSIEANFQGTFTALVTTQITCTTGACNPIGISAGTIITTPGYYCLTQDITGAITIASNSVVLDLNDHTIIGLGAGSGAGITSGGI